MTQRLPVPGGDNGTWGDILNGFLEVSLNADGTLSTSALSQAGGVLTSSIGQPSGVAGLNSSGLVPTTQLATGTASSSNFLRGDGTWVTPNSGSSALAADSDVAIVSPSNNQVLTYVSGSGKWENIAPAVATVFGRTGAITATTGDYTASQVTGALVNTNNLSDVSDAGSSRANIHIPVLTPAAAVAVANVSLTAPGLTCDGYSFTSGDLFLLTAQSTSSQNGLYSWTGASSTLTRPTEFATGATIKGRTIEIQNGTVYSGTTWVLTTPTAGVVVDSGGQTWSNISGSKTLAAQMRATVGAPIALVSDQSGDLAWDPNTQTIYGPLGSSVSVGFPWNATGVQLALATAPTISQSGTPEYEYGSVPTVTLPSCTAGKTLCLWIAKSTATVTTVSGGPSGVSWTKVASNYDSGNPGTVEIWLGTGYSTSGSTITPTITAAGNFVGYAQLCEITGILASSAVDTSYTPAAGTGNLSATITTNLPNDLAVAVAVNIPGNNLNTPSLSNNENSTQPYGMMWGVISSPSTNNVVSWHTQNNTDASMWAIVTLKTSA